MGSRQTAVLKKNFGNVKNKDMTLSKFLHKLPSTSYGKRGYKQAFFKKEKKKTTSISMFTYSVSRGLEDLL